VILSWKVRCDVCGKETINEDSANSSTPAGWLSGSVQLFDSTTHEGNLYGLICDECSALPVRELIVKQKVRREAEAAMLS